MTISIIIPAFNHARELVGCVRALRKQTLFPQEIIVVDDGSSDDPQTCLREAGLDVGIMWIHHERSLGAPVARNDGFACSSGEAVMFLDADAELRPDALETLHRVLMEQSDAAFAYSAFRFGGKVFRSQEFSAQALAQGNYIHTSGLIRRSWFPGFDPSLKKFQDWDLWLQIAERGGRGVYIPELLMTIRERSTGMSRWLPSWAYREPLRRLPWIRPLVQTYEERRATVQKKHEAWIRNQLLQKGDAVSGASWRSWAIAGGIFVILSALVIGTPWNGMAALLVALVLLGISVHDPRLGLGWVAFELLVGSKGGFLKYGSDVVNDGGIGVRVLQFAGFLVGTGVWGLRTRVWRDIDGRSLLREVWPWVALIGVIGYGVLRGLLLRQPFVLSDANAWGMLFLVAPLVFLSTRYTRVEVQRVLYPALRAGLFFLASATLIAFFFFSRSASEGVRDTAYLWIRQSGLGEITRASGSVFRIFFQSQVYLVFAWLWILVEGWRDRLPLRWITWLAWSAVAAGILASFSRSFWIGLLAGLGAIALMAVVTRESWRDGIRLVMRSVASFVSGGVLLVVLAFVPLWRGSPDLASAFSTRFAGGEAAASSRWQLLPELQKGIAEHPILGSGFGATLTYQSSDPRIVAKTGGAYTTYAFEWGWLDLWYKLGVGVLAIVGVLSWIGWRARLLPEADRLWIWASLITLSAIHVFTPYVNHPLGIGFLIYLWWKTVQKETPPNPGEESGV